MLLQLKGNADPKNHFHVPSDAGRALLATGAVEVPPPPVVPARKPVQWVAATMGEGLYPPVIRFSCPNCPHSGYQDSSHGTAHKTAVFRHCGRVETCPREVAEKYVELWKRWQDTTAPRARRR